MRSSGHLYFFFLLKIRSISACAYRICRAFFGPGSAFFCAGRGKRRFLRLLGLMARRWWPGPRARRCPHPPHDLTAAAARSDLILLKLDQLNPFASPPVPAWPETFSEQPG